MKKYTFIKSVYDEIGEVLAISPERIETLIYANSYDDNGQSIGAQDAGDYSLHNEYCYAREDIIAALFPGREALEWVEGKKADLIPIFDYETGITEEEEEAVQDWEDKNRTNTEVEGFNFWNGHNWMSIITDDESYNGAKTHEILSENEAEYYQQILNKIKTMTGENKAGMTVYTVEHEGTGYKIIDSYFADAFEEYSINEK